MSVSPVLLLWDRRRDGKLPGAWGQPTCCVQQQIWDPLCLEQGGRRELTPQNFFWPLHMCHVQQICTEKKHTHTLCTYKNIKNKKLSEKIGIQNKHLIMNYKEWILKKFFAILSFTLIFIAFCLLTVCVHVHDNTTATACVERSEDTRWESVLCCHHVDPRNGNKCLYPPSPLAGPQF